MARKITTKSPSAARTARAPRPSAAKRSSVAAAGTSATKAKARARTRATRPATARPVTPEAELWTAAMGALFTAAARLYKARPWRFVDGEDEPLFELDAPALGWPQACVWVMGQGAAGPGFTVFRSIDEFDAMCDSAEAHLLGSETLVTGVPEFSLTFAWRDRLPTPVARALEAHDWPAAGMRRGAPLYPVLTLVDAEGEEHEPAAGDVVFAWAACEALALFTEAHARDGLAVVEGDEPVRERYAVHGVPGAPGPVEVGVAAPHPATFGPPLAEAEWLEQYLAAHAAEPGPDDVTLGLTEHMAEAVIDAIETAGAPPLAEWTADDLSTLLVSYCPRAIELDAPEIDKAPAALAHWLRWLGQTGRVPRGGELAARCEAIAPLFAEQMRAAPDPPLAQLIDALREMGFDVASLAQLDDAVTAFNMQLHSELAPAGSSHPAAPARVTPAKVASASKRAARGGDGATRPRSTRRARG